MVKSQHCCSEIDVTLTLFSVVICLLGAYFDARGCRALKAFHRKREWASRADKDWEGKKKTAGTMGGRKSAGDGEERERHSWGRLHNTSFTKHCCQYVFLYSLNCCCHPRVPPALLQTHHNTHKHIVFSSLYCCVQLAESITGLLGRCCVRRGAGVEEQCTVLMEPCFC